MARRFLGDADMDGERSAAVHVSGAAAARCWRDQYEALGVGVIDLGCCCVWFFCLGGVFLRGGFLYRRFFFVFGRGGLGSAWESYCIVSCRYCIIA